MCPRLGGDCYCFADQPSENKMDQVGEGQCRVPCKGDSGFFCGGTTGLHLYISSKGGYLAIWLLQMILNQEIPVEVNNTSPQQLVRLVGSALGTVATRKRPCPALHRRRRIFAASMTRISSCRSLLTSGIGWLTSSSELFWDREFNRGRYCQIQLASFLGQSNYIF